MTRTSSIAAHPDELPRNSTSMTATTTMIRPPTEGQLRWAQFHHRRRAIQVRARVEALYQRPTSPSQVPGAVLPDDGNDASSVGSDSGGTMSSQSPPPSMDAPRRRRSKPKISRGRRALLRVSERRLRARQARIAQEGFVQSAGSGSCSSGSSSSDEEQAADPDQALAWIFAETKRYHQSKRRRRRKTNHHSIDKERGRRFDEARQALLRSVAAAQRPQFATVDTPTKIWTRPTEIPLWDVNYDALKVMGLPDQRRKSTGQGASDSPSALLSLDKGASWLVHLPKTEKTSNESRRVQQYHQHQATLSHEETLGHQPSSESIPFGPVSPVRQRFQEICSDFPKPSAVFSPPPNRHGNDRLRKYLEQLQQQVEESPDRTIDEKKEEDVQRDVLMSPAGVAVASPLAAVRLDFARAVQQRIEAIEGGSSHDLHGQLESWLESMDPEFLEEMETLNPGVQDRLRALYLGESSPSVKQLARIIESPPGASIQSHPQGLVKDFVTRMEEASRQQVLLSADGKLHKPTFAKLVNQYLLEAKGQTISPRRRQPLVDSLVSKFQESDETDSILDDEGRLDVPVFADLVTKYLAQVTGQDEAEIREVADWESLHTEEYRERSAFVKETTRQLHRHVIVDRISPHGEVEWCDVVERSMKAALPTSVVPPPVAVRRVAERCAALVPEAWEQVNTIEEVLEETLEEARQIHRAEAPTETPRQETAISSSLPVTPVTTQVTPSPQVKRLVGHLERAADVEPLVQDGTLHMPTFKKLVNQYWNETTQDMTDFTHAPTPVLLARAKRSSMTDHPIPSKSLDTVQRFLNSMESLVQERQLVDSQGMLDHQALEELVTQEIQKASLADGNTAINDPLGVIGEGHRDEYSPALSEETDFFSVIRQSRVDRTLPTRSVVSELTFESQRKTTSGYDSEGYHEKEGDRKEVRHIAEAVTSKVGGLLGRLFHRDDSSIERKDDLQAVAAYRKKQDERRLSDDTSSLSSFRALPEGIKSAVMNFRRASGAPHDSAGIASATSSEEHASSESGTRTSFHHSVDSQGHSDFSPERVKSFHKKVLEKSALIGGGELTKGIIDTDGSEASFDGVNPDMLASLLLSPTILTKRHQQAIRAIEKRNWDQVTYLTSANPWLCEMTDVTTNQYLLHKLSLYGGGEANIEQSTAAGVTVRYAPSPAELNAHMMGLFPSAVHKFDQDGNLPLHMACAAANASMVEILGEAFPGGATVRNEDGLLPIHLVILACGSPRAGIFGNSETAREMVQTILHLFPASVAVPDDEGNLPIHTAASVLRGDVGVSVIHLLLDEASRQLDDPCGARFRNKIAMEELDNETVETEPTDTPTIASHDAEEINHCTAISNDAKETALLAAIHARAGWEIVDALVQGRGGPMAALITDARGNNALHLLVSEEYQDLAAALTILKYAPQAARHRNEQGILPIEIACMHLLDSDLILAMVLVDLPIEIESRHSVEIKDRHGSSWWYLTCESDDHFVSVVEEIVSMCSYGQIRELCFMERYSGETLISRASPKCRDVLQKGLRFLGRFEFLGQSAILADPSRGIKVFDAIDHGVRENSFESEKRVILKCYADEAAFLHESAPIRKAEIDFSLFEEVSVYAVPHSGNTLDDSLNQFCISIERPQLTLGGVVSGMLGNEDCQTNDEVRKRYAIKVLSVLRVVCKALSSLHAAGQVHGNVSLAHIGKYDTKWKVGEVLGLQRVGTIFDPDRFSPSSPPESVVPRQDSSTAHEVTFRLDLLTSPAIDAWGFGKLAFEALVGEPLIRFDNAVAFYHDHKALMDIMHWNEFNLEETSLKLRQNAVSDNGVDFVVACLAPRPTDRPSMDDLLGHPLWKELRRQSR